MTSKKDITVLAIILFVLKITVENSNANGNYDL